MSNELTLAVISGIAVVMVAAFGYLGVVVGRKGEKQANGTLYSEFKEYVDDLKEEIVSLKQELLGLRLALREQSTSYKTQIDELEKRITQLLETIYKQRREIDYPPEGGATFKE